MKLNKRMLFGIISIALAAVIALIGIPAVIGKADAEIDVIRVKTGIEKGTVITEEMLESFKTVSSGVPGNVATSVKQVVGKYALVDMVTGDYILPSKISVSSPEKDAILSKLTGDKIAVSVSVKSVAGILANKLRTDDIVGIYSMVDGEAEKPRELQYVRIIALTNANGINIEDVTGDESRSASTVTFLVTERQAKRLIELEHSSIMHLTLISRGDITRGKELLSEQEDILNEIELEEREAGGTGDDFDFDFDFGAYESEGGI